jgi:poly-gamma-glutamate synthesis protein (capsule biosynthesis protein)
MNGEKSKIKNKSIGPILTVLLSIIFIYSFYKPYTVDFISEKKESEATSTISVVIAGDMMLDRNVRNTINKIGFEEYFNGVKDLIQGADIAIANLEGAMTTNVSITAAPYYSKELVFTFDPAMAPALADLGFDILGLANNHSYNFGVSGLESTRRYIGSAGMLYYGDPFNKDEISTVIVKDGIRIGIVGFHEFYYINFDKVIAEINRLRSEVDVLIITPHWGKEYDWNPTSLETKLAYQFIDAGADAVIGAHSHVVGKIDVYKSKRIYYSLGNFAFDQYFSKATSEGLVVMMEIEKKDSEIHIKYIDIPIKIERDGIKI